MKRTMSRTDRLRRLLRIGHARLCILLAIIGWFDWPHGQRRRRRLAAPGHGVGQRRPDQQRSLQGGVAPVSPCVGAISFISPPNVAAGTGQDSTSWQADLHRRSRAFDDVMFNRSVTPFQKTKIMSHRDQSHRWAGGAGVVKMILGWKQVCWAARRSRAKNDLERYVMVRSIPIRAPDRASCKYAIGSIGQRRHNLPKRLRLRPSRRRRRRLRKDPPESWIKNRKGARSRPCWAGSRRAGIGVQGDARASANRVVLVKGLGHRRGVAGVIRLQVSSCSRSAARIADSRVMNSSAVPL